jgi:hypothetical protein
VNCLAVSSLSRLSRIFWRRRLAEGIRQWRRHRGLFRGFHQGKLWLSRYLMQVFAHSGCMVSKFLLVCFQIETWICFAYFSISYGDYWWPQRWKKVGATYRLEQFDHRKFGTISGSQAKMGQLGITRDLHFSGHPFENWDCPGNSVTGGHFKNDSSQRLSQQDQAAVTVMSTGWK